MTCYHARAPVRLKEGFAFDGRDAVAVKNAVRGKNLGFADAGHEFFTLLSFVDRILLRLVGHAGMYTNYSDCSMKRFAPVMQNLPVVKTAE